MNTTTALTNLGFTATIAELNYTDGVTSNIQTQLDAKVGAASPTFTGTATAPTINASTALQIGGVAITATAAELNYTDVTTLGLTEASKAVTADANGVVSFDNGTIEESTVVTSSLTSVGTLTSLTVGGDVTVNAQGDLRLADSDSSNYVGFQAPATVASNVVWTLPAADGSANYLLKTDGF